MFCAAEQNLEAIQHTAITALAQAAGRMLGVLPYVSGVGWDQAWECCWPSVPRLRGEIREQGMLGQQGPIKDQVDSLSSKESSNNMKDTWIFKLVALVGRNSSLNIQN